MESAFCSPVKWDGSPLLHAVQPVHASQCRFDVSRSGRELLNPLEIGLLAPAGVMPSAQDFWHAVVESRSRLARKQAQRQSTISEGIC